jgi:hypothetical protein
VLWELFLSAKKVTKKETKREKTREKEKHDHVLDIKPYKRNARNA